jgi:glycosyltransferase involved in cell wall biosynthesis
MMITVVTESRQVWGAEKSLLSLLDGRARSVVVNAVVGQGSPLAQELARRRIEFVEVPFASDRGRKRSSPAGRAFGRVRDFLRASRSISSQARGSDWILVFSVWQLPQSVIAALMSRSRLAVDIHETFNNRVMVRVLGLLLRVLPRLVLAPSEYVLNVSGLRLDQRGTPILRVIPRSVGIPESVSRELQEQPSGHRPRLLLIGQIVPHKGVLELIESADWTRLGADLRVVGLGDDPERWTDYERAAVRAARANGVEIVTRVVRATEAFRNCDAVINNSHHEAFGRTLAEGAVCGLLPIAVGSHGPREIVETLEFGAVFPNVEEMAAALRNGGLIEAILARPRDAIARAARQRFAESEVASTYWATFAEVGSCDH